MQVKFNELFAVCGGHCLPQGGIDYRFVDVADALRDLGINSAVVPLYGDVQVIKRAFSCFV